MSSNYVYPDLPLIDVHVDRERIDNTSIYESPSGAEQRVSWYTVPRYRYRVHYPALRDYLAAPAPWNPYSELGAVLWFLDQHRGPGQSFLFSDLRTKKNLLAYSQNFAQASWPLTHLILGALNTAPDGTNTARRFTEDTAAGVEHYVQQSIAGLSDGAIASTSIRAAADTRGWLYVANVWRDATTVRGAWFNLATGAIGTIGTGVTASIANLGSVSGTGQWWCCMISGSVGSGGTAPFGRFKIGQSDNQATYTGDGTSGLYLWGAQVEPASSAGLYVPTGALPISGQVRVRFEEDTLRIRRVVNDIWEAEFSLITVAA